MVGERLLLPVPSIRTATLIPSLTFFKKMCKRRGRIKEEAQNNNNNKRELRMRIGKFWGD
jgi:hypothetical protein